MSETFSVAIDSLRKNKLRSVLTVLGVVIGVTTVIGMSSVINGLNASVAGQFESLGSNLIFVYRFNPTIRGRVPPEVLNRKQITLEDAEAIAGLPLVQAVSPVFRWFRPSQSATAFTVRYRDRIAKNTIIEGVTPDYQQVFNLQLAAGRWFNDADDRHRANVAILGHDVMETIFSVNVDPLGKEVELEGKIFRVIGVMQKRQNALTPGANPEDNMVEIPISTFQRMHPEFQDLRVAVKAVSQEAMPGAINQIENLLRSRRGLRPAEESDFAIFTQESFTTLWNDISGGIFTVMLAISSIALLVGGVGVMNIMLVSVTERTREIGIRKAIGARRRDILLQFLFEAMTLTALGGIMGIVAGAGITLAIRTLVPALPAAMSAFWTLLGFATSVGTGLIFGIYPAYRAAVLSPIEALRYE
jgi:putative ABC transport system permease protein